MGASTLSITSLATCLRYLQSMSLHFAPLDAEPMALFGKDLVLDNIVIVVTFASKKVPLWEI